jgi:2-polyprenyl-6-methoxyphenol hydroxylase-like FAD-dependent oxidoreductase
VQWGKSFSSLQQDGQSVTAIFEDGSSATGRLLVACDGAQSRARKELFPEQSDLHEIPVRMMGVKLHPSPEKVQVLRRLDPFFLQGTCSKNDSFVYLSCRRLPVSSAESFADQYLQYSKHQRLLRVMARGDTSTRCVFLGPTVRASLGMSRLLTYRHRN